jgi:hypothetical protein
VSMAYMKMTTSIARVLVLFDIKVVGTLGEESPDAEWDGQRKGDFQVKDRFGSLKDGQIIEFKTVT